MSITPNNTSERKRLISQKAKTLKSNNPSYSDFDVWLSAESIIDNQILNNVTSLKDAYKTLMIKFFSSIDMSEIGYEEIAKKYFTYVIDNDKLFNKLKKNQKVDNLYRNISLLSRDDALDDITRKSMLLTDTTLFGHDPKSVSKIQFDHKYRGVYRGGDFGHDFYYNAHCPNLSLIGKWLINCKPLLESGDLFYYPKLEIKSVFGNFFERDPEYTYFENHLFDAVIESQKLLGCYTTNILKNRFIETILSLDIPYIKNVNLENFSKICTDNYSDLEKFKDHMNNKFLEMYNASNGEFALGDIEKLSAQLKCDINKISKDIKNLKSDKAFNAVGGVVATTTASLCIINPEINSILSNIMSVTPLAVGLFSTLKSLNEYIRAEKKVEDEQFLFLWSLSNIKN